MYSATAGDLMACQVACDWLREKGHLVDVALAPPFSGGIDWRAVNPHDYSQLVFVCGPFRNIGPAITDFLDRFGHCHKVGLDLSMIEPVDVWNPFDRLIERDSNRATRADISFLCDQAKAPVVGVCLVHKQKEYKDRGRHAAAGDAIQRLLSTRELAAIAIDTRLDSNSTGLRTPREVESLIARVDVLVTTRLHGLVLALKNGVPVLAIDPIAGGAKISRQAETVGWPIVFTADALDDEKLQRGFDYCLSADAPAEARKCAQRARVQIEQIRNEFLSSLALHATPERS
jgi:hypothetical protein